MIYRDQKAENVLLDENGHAKLTDFGLSKDLRSDKLATTFCGTNEYLAPEIVKADSYGTAIDWWTLGILMYEMLYGKTPFFCTNKAQMFKRITHSDVPFPAGSDPTAEELIVGLLEKDPSKRFGLAQIKASNFMSGIDFDLVLERKIAPKYIPPKKDIFDPANFERTDEQFGESQATPVFGSPINIDGFSFDCLKPSPV